MYTDRISQAFVGANSYVSYGNFTSFTKMESLKVSASKPAVAAFTYNAS